MPLGEKKFEYEQEDSPESQVLDFIKEKHETLKNDYRTPDGQYVESCTLIANEVARIFLKAGKQSEIISISGKRVDNPYINANEMLKPLQYEGRVSWGAHVVCICEGVVYDPMIGQPLPLEEYIKTAFDSEVEITTIVPKDKIEEFVKR